MRARRNQGLFERLRGPSSTSYRGELQKRRAQAKRDARERQHQERLEAQRDREAKREQLLREKAQIRAANKLKRELLKEEAQERKAEAREKAQRRTAERLSAAAIERAYKRGAKTLGEAMEMAERGNPAYQILESRYSRDTNKTEVKVKAGGRTDWYYISGRVPKTELRQWLDYTVGRRMADNPRGSKGKFARCVKAVSERGGAVDPKAVCGAMEKKMRAKKSANPADSSVEAFKIFHGREPDELVTIAKQRHYHKHLAAAGELESLVIETPDKRHRVTLRDFDGSLLAFNEQALKELAKKGKVKLTQLFIEGGDQTVDLEDFGIDLDNVHELETLGKAVKIDYFTTKDHLGSEGGEAVYAHKFRTTNDNGKHVTVRIAKYPDVIYRVRDNQLELSGGSYEIRAEGIDK